MRNSIGRQHKIFGFDNFVQIVFFSKKKKDLTYFMHCR